MEPGLSANFLSAYSTTTKYLTALRRAGRLDENRKSSPAVASMPRIIDPCKPLIPRAIIPVFLLYRIRRGLVKHQQIDTRRECLCQQSSDRAALPSLITANTLSRRAAP